MEITGGKKGCKMEFQTIDNGIVILTVDDFVSTLDLSKTKLPNIDMFDSICQFKVFDKEKGWMFIDIVKVINEDKISSGINILATKIEVVDK